MSCWYLGSMDSNSCISTLISSRNFSTGEIFTNLSTHDRESITNPAGHPIVCIHLSLSQNQSIGANDFTYLGPPREALPNRLFLVVVDSKKNCLNTWVKVNDIVSFTWLVVSKIFYFHPYFFGEDCQFDEYFSKGLVQPPTSLPRRSEVYVWHWGNRSGTFFSTMRTKRQLGCPVGSGWING